MELSAWSDDQAHPMLGPLGHRWRHGQAVAGMARDLARLLAPEDADGLVATAYLGYAPALPASGFGERMTPEQRLAESRAI